MARLITLNFLPSNTQLLLSTTVQGTETLSIPLNNPYPFIFQNLARKITLTSADDLTGTDFIIHGTDQFGNKISEIMVGPDNETKESTLEYNSVTNISADEEYTNFSIGSGTTGTFQWIKLNTFSDIGAITLTAEVLSDLPDPIIYSIFTTLDNLGYYKNIGATYLYVQPKPPIFLGTDPLTTISGSNVVTVTVPSTGEFTTGDIVQISGAVDTNGITAVALNKKSMITVIDDTNFTYAAASNAAADGVGGGGAVTYSIPALPYRHPLENDLDESFFAQYPSLPAIQVVVSNSTPGAGLKVNILQQGIN